MTIECQIRDEKLQYDINREAARALSLSSGKIDKYAYLTGEEILLSNQQQIIKEAKFTYCLLGKAFENTIFKNIHNGIIPLEDVEKEQKRLKTELGRIKQGDPKNKSSQQVKTTNNIKNLYNLREKVVQMFNDYAKNMPRNIYESKQGTGF